MIFHQIICYLIGLYCQATIIKLDIDYFSLINKNKPYIDYSFPPNKTSLHGFNINKKVENSGLNNFIFKDIVWKRPSDIFWFDFKLFGIIEPNIIEQGNLGDCYFLAALSSLSKYPNHVKKLFMFNTTNISGVYVVILFDEKISSWREILVDDYLPVKTGIIIDDFAFTKTKDYSIWPHLLEKAYAKYKGSYSDIHGGYTANALRTLTGSEVSTFYHSNFKSNNVKKENEFILDFFKDLKKASDAGYIICTGSYPIQEDNKNSVKGIIPSHAYSIIDILYFYDDENLPVRLIKLRNPHGKNEWEGEWSDKSNKWSSERIKIEGKYHGDKIDGIFFMELKDFIKYFYSTDICEFKEN